MGMKMKKSKCESCGDYEIRDRVIKTDTVLGVELAFSSKWKWCRRKNNWCKSSAGHCGEVNFEENKKLTLNDKLIEE